MNNTIPFHSAPHAPQITVDVNILTMLKQAASCLTEAAGRDVYLAAIGPDMELTIIMEEDAPSVLPCFDEDDALITVKGAPLFISYNPAQVLKLAGKRYLTGPVIFYRTDGHSTIVSLTVEDADQWKRYEIFQDTLGGRPYLFNGGLPPGGSDGSGTPGIDYQIPAEALTDSEFAAIYKEAQKYVGTPYVWGGSTPETGFDCSGYVCWVYNQNGYNVGRTTANGLWQKSQHISEAEAKPGDLVFFEGTYDTPGKSHVGIVRPVRTIVEVEKGGCG